MSEQFTSSDENENTDQGVEEKEDPTATSSENQSSDNEKENLNDHSGSNDDHDSEEIITGPDESDFNGESASAEAGGEAVAEKNHAVAQTLFFWLQALTVVLIVVILIFVFIGRIITVDGSSMLPTLENGDVLILHSIAYTPSQDDIVVLTKEFAGYTDRPIVKRVIATEGQTIRIDYKNDTVYVDDVALDEPYIYESDLQLPRYDSKMTLSGDPEDEVYELTVPEDCVFVMGDNRNNSTDSRYVDLSAIDTRYILGRVDLVLFPFSHFGLVH